MTPHKIPSLPLPQPLLSPLSDNEFLVGLLAKLTQQDSSEVRRRFECEMQDLGINVREALAQWQLQPYVWHDKMAEFYQQTDAFLFETLIWNRNAVKCQMRAWIGNYLQRNHSQPVRVLTYGDGLGIDSLYLTQAGHRVDYFEVSEKCVRFAQAIGERLGISLTVLESKDAIVPGAYDYVVCLDVLEHVPEPQHLVSELAKYLKPGGRLITHAPFWYIHPAVVTHLTANRKFSGDIARLYRPAGFRLIDGKFFWAPIVLELVVGTDQRTTVPIRKRFSLAVGGLLLYVGRFWNWPHLFIAGQLCK